MSFKKKLLTKQSQICEEITNQLEQSNKPNTLKAIFLGLLCLFVFSITRILAVFIIAIVIYFLSLIPILGSILSRFFLFREESPTMFAIFLSVYIAYLLVSYIQGKLIKDTPTKKLSRKIIGTIILIFHILFFVLSILFAINGEEVGENIFANISCVICALFFIYQD